LHNYTNIFKNSYSQGSCTVKDLNVHCESVPAQTAKYYAPFCGSGNTAA
jgi:hypothetical protein